MNKSKQFVAEFENIAWEEELNQEKISIQSC